jgi:hypothetical protein
VSVDVKAGSQICLQYSHVETVEYKASAETEVTFARAQHPQDKSGQLNFTPKKGAGCAFSPRNLNPNYRLLPVELALLTSCSSTAGEVDATALTLSRGPPQGVDFRRHTMPPRRDL